MKKNGRKHKCARSVNTDSKTEILTKSINIVFCSDKFDKRHQSISIISACSNLYYI